MFLSPTAQEMYDKLAAVSTATSNEEIRVIAEVVTVLLIALNDIGGRIARMEGLKP